MRRVGHSGAGTPGMETGAAAADLAGAHADRLRHRDGRPGRDFGPDIGLGLGLQREMRFGQFASGEDARERETAFQDKVQRALRDASHPAEPTDERDRARLLATAGPETPQPPHRPAIAPAEDAGALRADQALRLDALAERIDAAAKAEMRTGRLGEVALRIDLGTENLGIASVTIRFSPEGLDIVLAPDGSAASAASLAAAQALAERLHQRFAQRTVRVYEAAPAETEARRDGMSEIASLFRAAGGQS